MLVYTGLKEDGQKLYQDAFTGMVTTLEQAQFRPSDRRERRAMLQKNRQHNNRKPNLHRVMQTVILKNSKDEDTGRRKFIFHNSCNALTRKKLKAFKEYGIII